MMKVDVVGRVFVALGLLVVLTGCWDNRPINSRDMVLAMGLAPDHHPGAFSTVFQAPTPSAVSAGSSGSSSGGSSKKDTFDVVGSGPDLSETFNEAQAQVSKDLYLGQMQLIVLSTRLQPMYFKRAFDGLGRIATLAKTPFVIASPTPLIKLLHHTSPQDRFPSLYFSTLFSCHTCQTDAFGVRLWQVLVRLATPGVDIFLPVATPLKDGYLVDSVALYRHFQYVTTLTPRQSMAFGILDAISHKGSIFLPHYNASLRAIAGSSALTTHLRHGQVDATFTIKLTSTLEGIGSVTETAAQIAGMSDRASATIAASCLNLLQVTQKDDVDPLGVGRTLSWQNPRAFDHFRHWHQEYPHVHMRVHVSVTINKMGDVK